MIRYLVASALAIATVQGCTNHKDPQEEYDQIPSRRVYKPPPPGEVRPVPPHAIHETGVGPYTLGASLRDILGLLQRGPRVVLMQIDGLVDYSLVRAEQDGLLIGVEHPAGVSFLTAIEKEIALTESGVGVSTPEPRLREAMGPELRSPHLLMDPRMVSFTALANVRFVLMDMNRDKESAGDAKGKGGAEAASAGRAPKAEPVREVIAVVVRRDPGAWAFASPSSASSPAAAADETAAGIGSAPARPQVPSSFGSSGPVPGSMSAPLSRGTSAHGAPVPAAKPGAQAPGAPAMPSAVGDAGPAAAKPADGPRCQALAAHTGEVIAFARLAEPVVAVLAGCFTGTPEAAVVTAERVVVIGGEPGKLRRLASQPTVGTTFASILDMDGDGHAEIALVSETVTEEERLVRIELLRMENGRLSPVVADDVYRLSATKAAWIGAQLSEVELLIELWAGADSVRVTGLYVQNGSPPVVVPLQVKTIPVRRKRPVPGPGGAASGDTSAPVVPVPTDSSPGLVSDLPPDAAVP